MIRLHFSCIASIACGAGLAVTSALAQSTANAQVAVTLDAHIYAGQQIPSGTFICSGTPTCSVTNSYPTDCPAGGTFTSTMTGLNLGQSGAVQGTINQTTTASTLVDGACSSVSAEWRYNYTGNWNASTQAGTFSINSWSYTISSSAGTTDACALIPNACPPFAGSFRLQAAASPPPPVFPLTVTSNITPTTATATAAIQFRPQDVGTNGNVYVFAVAPSNLVKAGDLSKAMVVGKSSEDDKDSAPCVLAQLNAAGQLQATTPEQLQAALSGVLSSSGATVPILTNASTPAVAGSTFYVGYGASNSAMLTGGVFRNALTVPGAGVCPLVSSQTALWWNPAESGWGLNLNHQGNILFGTLFTYDTSRAPYWLVMSNGVMQPDGVTFTGDLYQTKGSPFNANPFTPIGAGDLTKVGTMTVAFQDVNSGTLQYSVNGVQVSKGILRQVFGTRAAACFPTTASRATSTNYQDLWWNPAESGWGINITHQDNTLFATLFTYDAAGKGLWLVMSGGTRQSDGSYIGDLFETRGPAFNANPFTPIGAGDISTVGNMRLSFRDGNNGTLTYTYKGATVTKAITRQLFSTTAPLCN